MSNTTTQAQNAPAVEQKPTVKIQIGQFGNGRYSPAMAELYHDSQRLLGFTPEQAHVTACRLGIDAGQLNSSKVTLSYGKSTDKEGRRTLKEITKGVKLVNTWAMSVGAVCSQLDDARKNGLIVNDCTMADPIMEAINAAVERLDK